MSNLEASVYEVNKAAMNSQAPLDPLALNAATLELGKYLVSQEYTMLLSNERHDYTIFHTSSGDDKTAARTINITLTNRGYVLAIDKQPDGAYEIWIRDFDTKENFVYYLFPYSDAVVEV